MPAVRPKLSTIHRLYSTSGVVSVYSNPGSETEQENSILLQMDNTGDSGAYIDSGPLVHTITANNGAVQSAGAAKWGSGGTLFVRSSGHYLSTPHHAALDLADGGFQLDFWLKRVSNTGTQVFCGKGTGLGERWHFMVHNTGELEMGSDASTSHVKSGPGHLNSNGVWYYVSLFRLNGRLNIAEDGKIIASSDDTTDFTATAGGGDFFIGSDAHVGGGSTVDGSMDAFRLSKGYLSQGVLVENDIAYTRNFPVPTAAPS